MPTASGANSVASALGFRSGATPFGHDHTNTTPRQSSSKADISIWQKSGHFYLALTIRFQLCQPERAAEALECYSHRQSHFGL